MTQRRALLLIALFVAFMLGNFVWFIATWNADKEEPVVERQTTPQLHFAVTIPAGGSSLSTSSALTKDSAT